MHHHAEYISEKIGRMGILFRIRKCMMHAVHDGVSPGWQVRRPLESVGKKVEKTFPEFVHGEHLVRSITVVEKSLEKQRTKPVRKEKSKYCHLGNF